jgi:hypothetical protein
MRAPVSIAMGLVFNTAAHTEVGAFGTTLCERCIHDVGIADFPRDRSLTCVLYKAMYNNLKGEAAGDECPSASAMGHGANLTVKLGALGWATAGVPHVRLWMWCVVGYAGGLAIKDKR